jgi:diacylglycerol diphosphate phosphatase/phosphatidate phosphatase
MGAAIGTSCALIAFRQTFAAIFDFRFNHILLPRTSSLFHRSAVSTPGGLFYTYDGVAGRSEDYPFTTEGGWRRDMEGYVGAPGDASVLVAGGRGVAPFGNRSNVNGATARRDVNGSNNATGVV